jgi:hypothetical protein
MADFPDVSPGAISDLAGSLRRISESVAVIGLDTENVRDSVTASEQWQGSASEKWRAVVTDRVGDAGLTNAVMGSAASMLSGLAADLAAERGTYDRLSSQLSSLRLTQSVASRFAVPVQVMNPDVQVQAAMDACAARAAQLLQDAARQLLGYAVLAGDIHAVPVADRTPGVPDGASRQAASLQLLATLFGSVTGNRAAGSKFEQAVLKALGLTKNNEVWRPDPPFEGRLTASGLARGTIPDSQGSNYLIEVKGTSKLELRYQLRLQVLQARLFNKPLWVIKAAGQTADQGVVQAAEGTKGGVIYTGDNGKTFTDGNGNPVQVSYDKGTDTVTVRGYTSVTGGSGAAAIDSAPPPDPSAPSSPVDPGVADGTAVPPDVPVVPDVPDDPGVPIDPEIIP